MKKTVTQWVFEREVTEVPANKKPKPAKVSVTYPEPWIERRPNGRRHRPIAVVVRRTVRVFEREVTEVPANKKAKTSKVLAVYPEPVLKSQKLRKYYKSEINHNSLYINK